MGTGISCVRAFRLVVLGPEWLATTEPQGYARIRSLGQNNPKTYTYRLYTSDVKNFTTNLPKKSKV